MVNLKHVGIVGAGQMGSGIAQVCAAAGLDVSLVDVSDAALEVFSEEFGDPKYRPAPLLKEMVSAGRLGRKSKRGFYSYE